MYTEWEIDGGAMELGKRKQRLYFRVIPNLVCSIVQFLFFPTGFGLSAWPPVYQINPLAFISRVTSEN